MPKSRRKGKHTGAKWCVPRHRTLCAASADQLERSIEKQERREAKREIEEQQEEQR